METRELSSAVQDYVREIYKLELEGTRVSTSTLAKRMSVAQPSASAMAKRLAGLGLVERAPYRGVVLTDAGRRVALELVRHNRLLERYLVDSLGLPLDVVHAEADRLEHALSEELESRIDEALGFPTHDPHGDPIPDRQLRLEQLSPRAIVDLEPGERATVMRVPGGDPPLLRYLTHLPLLPGKPIELAFLAPFGGPATVRSSTGEHAISRELAAAIGVT